MQTSNRDHLAKRSRFYQSQIDIECLQKGDKYFTLKDNIVIFICTFDLFERALPVYTFRNMCEENKGLYLDDGTTKVFLNTTNHNGMHDKKLAEFLRFVDTANNKNFATDDTFIRQLVDAVENIKENKDWRVEYMSLNATLDFAVWEGEQRGEQKGKLAEKMGVAQKMIQNGIAVAEIMQYTELSLSDIENLKNKMFLDME